MVAQPPEPGQPDATLKTPPTGAAASALPPDASSAPSSVVFGKYVRTTRLGAGGMGEVWKAWDPELQRWAALKFLKGADRDELLRFQREARTAAQLAHPNIAAVFDVGEVGDKHFIAMQFVPGRDLSTFPRNDRRRLVELVRDAALAAHHAHAKGIIHRDLKPANLMVDQDGRLFVMDFGLAKQLAVKSSLSASGLMIGTPAYMPPEQAQGRIHEVDARSDVYALGATLYDLLADRPPFRDENVVDLLMKVVSEEPTPPRFVNSRIDLDLDTIVMKCLEKDPGRRYATARALADDLTRWLEDEPIQARPASLAYRVRKRLAKRKAVFAALAATVLLAASSVVLVLALRRKEGELSEKHRLLVHNMRETTDVYLRAALDLRRVGHVAAMREYADRMRDACTRVSRELPGDPEPHYRLGRMLRAQMRDSEALAEQDLALSKNPDYAPALYERVVLLARRHRNEWNELWDEAWRHVGRRLVEGTGAVRPGAAPLTLPADETLAAHGSDARRTLDAIRRDLQRLEGREGRPSTLGNAELACARGLQAWASWDFPQARRHLEEAVRLQPLLEEAYEALAMVALEKADYEEAARWYREGARQDRGYVRHLEGLADALENCANRLGAAAADACHEQAVAALDQAIATWDSAPTAWALRARIRGNWGLTLMQRGRDARRTCEQAVEDGDAAVQRDPSKSEAWCARGLARVNLSLARMTFAEDVRGLLASAIGDFTKAVDLRPDSRKPWTYRGNAHTYLASHFRGVEEREHVQAAVDDYSRALECDPARPESWIARSMARMHLGDISGDDAGLFESALADAEEARQRAPKSATAFTQAALARARVARVRADRAECEEEFTRALANLERAIEMQPSGVLVYYRMRLRTQWAEARTRNGGDPSPLYAAAVADGRSITTAAPNAEWYLREQLAQVLLDWAAAARRAGAPAEELFAAAVEGFKQAAAADERRCTGWIRLAAAFEDWAAYRSATRGETQGLYAEAVHAADRAVELRDASGEAAAIRAMVRFQMGLRSGSDAPAMFDAAIADYDQAILARPDHARWWRLRAWVRVNRARKTADPLPQYEAALRDFDQAVRLDPRDADNLEYRGTGHFCLGALAYDSGGDAVVHFAAAVTDLEQALAIKSTASMWEWAGRANVFWARALTRRRETAGERYRAARRCFEEAIRLEPSRRAKVEVEMTETQNYLAAHPDE